MTVAELVDKLSRYDPGWIVYVGTPDAIGLAVNVDNDCFDFDVGPAVLIEAEDEA